MGNIHQSTRSYEDWLRRQLGGDLVEKDLERKHEKMRRDAFSFLRATYWRWAETVLEICPDVADAPGVLAVGDIHLENFGTWRDADGRLAWGVSDFDEAAEMPYALDLIRLATSALVASPQAGVAARRPVRGDPEGIPPGSGGAAAADPRPRPRLAARARRGVGEAARQVLEEDRAARHGAGAGELPAAPSPPPCRSRAWR